MAKGFTVELKGAKKGGNGMVYALGAVGTAFAVDYWLSNRDEETKLAVSESWQKAIEKVILRKREAQKNWDRALELARERIAADKAAKAARARERWQRAIRAVMDRNRRTTRNWDNALNRANRRIRANKKAAEEARRAAELKAEQDRITAEQAAERERLAAEAEKLARDAEAARLAQEAALQAQRERLAREAAAEAAKLQAERERLAAEAEALRKERLAREEAARKAKEAAEAARRAALARKRWTDAIAYVRNALRANKKSDVAAQKWQAIANALVEAQKGKSALARARWAKAIAAVMEKNAAERAFKKFLEQMQEFALAVLKIFLMLALAWFFYAGEHQQVENKIPTLGAGKSYETFQTPALGYVEESTSPIAVIASEPQEIESTQIATITRTLEVEDNWWFIALLVCGTMII